MVESIKQDIVLFINQERRKPNINEIPKVYKLFLKILNKSIFEIYSKMKNHKGLNLYYIIKSGTNLLWQVFWFIYIYSYNIKLTLFLSERSILLYIEFIFMSRNPIFNNELNFVPTIYDALQFSMKKTIGSLKLSPIKSLKIKSTLELYKTITFDYKLLIQHIFSDLFTHQEENNGNIFNIDYILLNFNKTPNKVIQNDYEENEKKEIPNNYEEDENNENNEKNENNDKLSEYIVSFLEKINGIFYKNLSNLYQTNNPNDVNFYQLIKNIFSLNLTLNYKIILLKINIELFLDNNKNISLLKIYKSIKDDFISLIRNEDNIDILGEEELLNIKKKKIYKHLSKFQK